MSTFLLEIGLEEIPAHLVTSSENQLIERTKKFLSEHRLTVGDIKPYSTPRRLAVVLTDVAETSESLSEEKRGPSVDRAQDENGNWTKAALGFARGQGANPEAFEIKDGYVWLTKHTAGVAANEILAKIGDEVVAQMKFSTYMKWANHSFLYVRPIRWLVALLDSEVISFNVLDITTDRFTRGHRFLSSEHVEIASADNYVTTLQGANVVVDATVRKNEIRSQLNAIAEANGWVLQLETDAAQDLLEEVNNIVEWPTAFAGSFDEKYLEIPDEVLVTSMREHQRFFFVTNEKGQLLPHFLSIRNGNREHLNNVIAGNEKVLVARLEDAEFFYHEDQTKSISDYMTKVKKLVFHEKIGTVYEHMQRTGALASAMAAALKFDETQQADLSRASEIYKFDLMTGMVGEFDELQGIMGEHYAKLFGEDDAVATAIREHYMPTSANGEVARSEIGALLAVADKLDSIVTFFAAGLIPSGSNDPYGLRRAATGIVRTLVDKKWHIDLLPLLADFVQQQGKVTDTDLTTVVDFMLDRVRKLSLDAGIRQDIVTAGLGNVDMADIVYISQRVEVLSQHSGDGNFRDVIEALTRVDRLAVKQVTNTTVDPTKFENQSEKDLYQATLTLDLNTLMHDGAENLYMALANLQQPIAAYFDETMVNAEDESVKDNRYAQLNVIQRLTNGLGDLTQIVIK
ncbi:glycine--tRNA ligase subunit beta [Leuconostoc pseudomesenteroides]|jgi:glycyl-tRNA synthetase beta chain|uniref:glycine--tRNA ligase subunit beta n=1 Tax=Leuconostoc pseudomesenteroides TaxID=33968 RepID=UPI001B8DA50C|nr:glycine--tRNA ligase subunit beta [Leuconostoc pseudomesenteroides]MBS0956963.1 glycine--tRNA ligase subunit beta [Leuconostoc pseudomesenteroides]MCT4381305.1 glycine--tRNA ligase subunit beta [Leuconostoc pseudomesenteroides]MCT4412486.1 glycine--tRNA ligase subunit beta [Leuconostoc pseudomesenteroides]